MCLWREGVCVVVGGGGYRRDRACGVGRGEGAMQERLRGLFAVLKADSYTHLEVAGQ